MLTKVHTKADSIVHYSGALSEIVQPEINLDKTDN